MFNLFNKKNEEVRRDVINELMWDPSLNSTQVQVTANDGIVTLRGSVPHFSEKQSAELAAQRVGGVKAVADELEVRGLLEKTDEEIARAAINAFKWNYSVPADVKVSVENGWVTLSGETEWDYQRIAAKDAVGELLGVIGVTNNIFITPKVQSADVKTCIEDALKRAAEFEGKNISVTVNGSNVTLSGNVHSMAEKNEARQAAWMAPGVMTVDNNLTISQW